MTFTAGGTKTATIVLGARARSLLKHLHRVKLTVTGAGVAAAVASATLH